MNNSGKIIKIGAIGAIISLLSMLVITVIIQMIDFDYILVMEKYFSGEKPLTQDVFQKSMGVFNGAMIVDTFLVIGQFLAWIGIAVLVKRKYSLLGRIVLIIGIAGASFDFFQNTIAV